MAEFTCAPFLGVLADSTAVSHSWGHNCSLEACAKTNPQDQLSKVRCSQTSQVCEERMRYYANISAIKAGALPCTINGWAGKGGRRAKKPPTPTAWESQQS